MSISEPREVPTATGLSKWLVFRVASDGGVVVTFIEQALHQEAVHGALAEARTWGELRTLLPTSAWDDLTDRLWDCRENDLDGEDPDYRVWDDADAPFEARHLELDDFPGWPDQVVDHTLPDDAFLECGVEPSCLCNGSFWYFPPEHSEQLLAALRTRGYHVEYTPFLRGF